jgi:hypothetical protein
VQPPQHQSPIPRELPFSFVAFILLAAQKIMLNCSGSKPTGICMQIIRTTAALVVGAVVCLNAAFAHAGPCTADIAQFEMAIRQSAGNPMAGLTARQSVAAQLDRQPTVASMKRENQRLKSEFAATMARAKRLDARGDRTGCIGALNAAKRMYIL